MTEVQLFTQELFTTDSFRFIEVRWISLSIAGTCTVFLMELGYEYPKMMMNVIVSTFLLVFTIESTFFIGIKLDYFIFSMAKLVLLFLTILVIIHTLKLLCRRCKFKI